MTAAGARGLQTVISIRVQPTEDLLLTTLHLSTDSLKSTKIQKNKRKKIQNKPSNIRKENKKIKWNQTNRQHQRRHSLLEHTGVGFLYLVISGDFVFVNFYTHTNKDCPSKSAVSPPKFKIKSFDDPRKTFENKKVLPVLFVRGRRPLLDYRHCTFIFSYIYYI